MRSSAKKSSFKKKAGASWLTKYKPRALAINRQAPGLGRSLKTRLETSIFFNPTIGGNGVWTGYLNPGSCFDPTGDLSGIQPAGFDQLKAMYARYLVTGGSVEVELACSATSGHNFVAAGYPSTVSTALSTFQGYASQPYSKEVTVAGGMTRRMKWKFDTQKIVGSRLPVIAEDCGALVTADPAIGQNVVFPLMVQCDQALAYQAITMRIKIVQDVIFDQRIQVVDV